MKFRFLPVVLAAVAVLGVTVAGARPAQAHDCDDNGWRVSRYRGDYDGDSCRRERYHARRAYYGDRYDGGYSRYYDAGYDYPAYSRYHTYRRHYRTVPREVTVYRSAPIYHARRVYRTYRTTRHYCRPAHRVTRVVRVTTVYR